MIKHKSLIVMFFSIVAVVVGISIGAVNVNAETVSGQCGKLARWSLDTETGEMVITGSGETKFVQNRDWTNYKSSIKSVVVSDEVTNIFEGAFSGCTNLKSIQLGTGITKIGKNAFASCSRLESITIPDSVTEIGASAFNSCTSLTAVTVPDSVTELGASAFNNCKSLESCVLSDNITVLYSSCFQGCVSLASVKLPAKLTDIYDLVFADCISLKNITFPDGLEYIGSESFAYSGLTELFIPASVSYISDAAFAGNNDLVSLKVAEESEYCYSVSNCIIYKEWKAVAVGCNNSVIPIDEDVKAILFGSFLGLTKLTTINIPKNTEYISNLSFQGTNNLKSIYVYSSVIAEGMVKDGAFPYIHDFVDTFVIEKSVVADGMDTEIYTVEEIQYYNYTYVIFSRHTHDWKKCNGGGFYGERCSVCEVKRGSDVCTDHVYGEKHNADSHWQECECGEQKDVANHNWDGGKVTRQPSYSQDGERVYTCSVCTETKSVSIPKLVAEVTTKEPEATTTPETETQVPDTEKTEVTTDQPEEETFDVTDTTPVTDDASSSSVTEPVPDTESAAATTGSVGSEDNEASEEDNDNSTVIIAVAAGVALAGAAAAAVIIKKRK